jgi:hypothetical protein
VLHKRTANVVRAGESVHDGLLRFMVHVRQSVPARLKYKRHFVECRIYRISEIQSWSFT